MLARIQSMASGIASKAQAYTTKSIYYSKVVGELSKQVYLKEGMQPPSVSDFQSVYTKLYKQALSVALKPKQSLSMFKNVQKDDVVKYGAYGIQLAGLYSLGEVIGRRKVVGYTNYAAHH
ncbi:LANO_0F04632g1_1 [Lachancea nothofagi CBS 11611]|uniref:LANO_0F04632g1_1 n=1 Tax=Lachancea nothofagi CBS 11611 TaxID=1266666 RepID=A0A1G4K7P7_9SACH|nr:LANO_0F04632g1_1 [Lachancea nothofagi CBS 11611]